VGDRWHDVVPALTLGGHGMLVPSPETPPADLTQARDTSAGVEIVPTLSEGVDEIIEALET
jgi:hypothetical protein